VLKMAAERFRMIKAAGNEKSSQVMVADSDHYYENRGEELTQVISQWLHSL
jgi:alpha/beta superfamily hydrolase